MWLSGQGFINKKTKLNNQINKNYFDDDELADHIESNYWNGVSALARAWDCDKAISEYSMIFFCLFFSLFF